MTGADLLEQLGRSRDLGFLGDGPLEQHVEQSSVLLAAIADLSTAPSHAHRLLDLGSGGGVPGLIAVADGRWAQVDLLDRSERRCAFLRSALAAVRTSLVVRSDVLCGVAEVLGREAELRESYGAVMCRSFGPPAATLECASAFVAIGGVVAVTDPPDGRNWPRDVPLLALRRELSRAETPAFTIYRKHAALGVHYPRREGVPVRRPLFEGSGR